MKYRFSAQHLSNCLLKIAIIALFFFAQNLATKHFANTYDAKLLLIVFFGYILIGFTIGFEILLMKKENNSVFVDWSLMVSYLIPLVIIFILLYFNVNGFTFRVFGSMGFAFMNVLLIMVGYIIARSVKRRVIA